MELCRACLSSEKGVVFFNEYFIETYNLLTNLNIKLNDGLSQHFCQKCVDTINHFMEFRAKCTNAETALQQSLDGVKIEFDLPDKYESIDVLQLVVEPEPSPSQSPDIPVRKKSRRKVKAKNNELLDIVPKKNRNQIDSKFMDNLQNIELDIKEEVQAEESDHNIFDSYFDGTSTDVPSDTEVLAKHQNKGIKKEKSKKVTFKRKSSKLPKVTSIKKSRELPKVTSKNKSRELRNKTKSVLLETLSCGLCKESFEKESLPKHLEDHKLRSTTCAICNDRFSNWRALIAHRITHLPQSEHRCHICWKFARSVAALEFHFINQHNDGEKAELACKICSRAYDSVIQLKKHVYYAHSKRTFICDYCNKVCPTKQQLRTHISGHTNLKQYACTLCSFACNFLTGLKDHIIRKHSPEKVTCKKCGRIFPNQEEYDKHECKPNYQICPICGKQLSSRKQLTCHLRVHSDVKKYKCDRCSASYKSRPALRVHIARHDGVRSQQCEFCRRKFYSASVLIKHRRVHTGEKPYVCKICNKGFTGNHNLKVHMKVHGEHLVIKRVKDAVDVASIFQSI